MTAKDRDDDRLRLREDLRSTEMRHEQAILEAGIKRLVRGLSPYGVLSRDALRHEVGAESWHEAWFDRALEAAVRDGQIEALPLGFYALPQGARRG